MRLCSYLSTRDCPYVCTYITSHNFPCYVCRSESTLITIAAMARAITSAFLFASPGIVSLLIFSTYALTTGDPLSPAIVFTTVSLIINVRISAIMLMLRAILGMQEANVACKRIQVCTAPLSVRNRLLHTICTVYVQYCMYRYVHVYSLVSTVLYVKICTYVRYCMYRYEHTYSLVCTDMCICTVLYVQIRIHICTVLYVQICTYCTYIHSCMYRYVLMYSIVMYTVI